MFNKKILIILCLTIFHSGSIYAKPVYEKLWTGMPLKEFNSLNLGPHISKQKRNVAITNYGLINLDSNSLTRYFSLNDTLWTGVLVEMKNDELREYSLMGTTEINKQNLQDIFSDLIRVHGVNFELKDHRSLSKKGYSVIWHHENQMVALNILIDKKEIYKISIKNARNLTKKEDNLSLKEDAILALQPFLGESFHRLDPFQVANNNSELNH